MHNKNVSWTPFPKKRAGTSLHIFFVASLAERREGRGTHKQVRRGGEILGGLAEDIDMEELCSYRVAKKKEGRKEMPQ